MKLVKPWIGVACLAAAFLASQPVFARPPERIYRVGFLGTRFPSTPSHPDVYYDAFVSEMRGLGYVEGKNLVIEWRFAEDHADRLPALAGDLTRTSPDVLVTHSVVATQALQGATRTTPIVFAAITDPVGNHLIESLAHPGGNTTGMSLLAIELTSKRVEILKELIPALSKLAVFVNPDTPAHRAMLKSAEDAARVIGTRVLPVSVRNREEIEPGINQIRAARAEALLVPEDPVFLGHSRLIARLALDNRTGSMVCSREGVEAGGLVRYGMSLLDGYRLAARLVDMILKGAKPADIPVEQPTKIEFLINGTTAKALGLTIPPELLVQADKVIE